MAKGLNQAKRGRLKDRLRAEHGDGCHWCGVDMLFLGSEEWEPNHPLSATFEHLVKRSEGGSWHMQNIRLAHRFCNMERNREERQDHHMNSRMTDIEIRAAVANFRTAVNLQADELKSIGKGCPNTFAAGSSYACMNMAVALMERVLSGGLSARTRHLLIAAVDDVHTRLDADHFKGIIYAPETMPSDRMPEEGGEGHHILPGSFAASAISTARSACG